MTHARCTCPNFEDDDGTPIYALLLTCPVHGTTAQEREKERYRPMSDDEYEATFPKPSDQGTKQ